jgi:hypothetical protein
MVKKETTDAIARSASIRARWTNDYAARRRANRRASEPVIEELREAGFDVRSVAVLRLLGRSRLLRRPYEEAVPILLKWMPRMENAAIKSNIVRALSIPSIPGIGPRFVAESRRTRDLATMRDVIGYDTIGDALDAQVDVKDTDELLDANDNDLLREALGNGLSIVANDEIADDLIELLQDERMIRAQPYLVLGLGKLSDSRVVSLLLSLMKERNLTPFALAALGKLRAVEAADAVRASVTSPIRPIADAARAALKKIEKGKPRLAQAGARRRRK